MLVNLFRQAPLDATFNDLVVGRERCLVIEFKRSAASLAEERAKNRTALRAALIHDTAFYNACLCGHVVLYGRVAVGGWTSACARTSTCSALPSR